MIRKKIFFITVLPGLFLCISSHVLQAAEEAPSTDQGRKIYNIKTPYDDITWDDVIQSQQKPISGDNIGIWFNYRDLLPDSRVSAVWYYRDRGRLRRIEGGMVDLISGRPWARAYLPVVAAQNYPHGDYEVYFYVDGRPDNRISFNWRGPRQPGVWAGAGPYGSSSGGRSDFEEAVAEYIET